MSRRVLALASLLLPLVGVTSVCATELNRIVLRVNDHIATLHDFELRRAERVGQVQRAELAPEDRREFMSELGERVMREMYEELLLLSRADQLGLRAGEVEVEQAFRDTVDSLGIEGEEELQAALAASGITEDGLRRQISRGMIMQQVIGREVRPRVQLEEEELRRYHRDNIADFQTQERWQLRDAVVLDDAGVPAERREEIAAEIRRRTLTGESVADSAADFVELGQVTVIELDWVLRGDLEPALEEAATQLAVGEVSDPVRGRGGLHVLHLLDHEEVRPRTFAEVEEEITSRLQKNRFGAEMEGYLKEIEESSFIAAHPPAEAEGFRLDLGSEVLEDADALFESVASSAEADVGGESAERGEVSAPAAASANVVEEASAKPVAEPSTEQPVEDPTPEPAPPPRQSVEPEIPTDAPTRELPPS